MLLILSKDNEPTTNLVIDWLDFFNIKFVRCNLEDPISLIKININQEQEPIQVEIKSRGEIIDIKKITSYWYRRGSFSLVKPIFNIYNNEIDPVLLNEWEEIKSYLFFLLEQKKHLGSYSKEHNHNKLIAINLAMQVGLKIPPTQIVMKKSDIMKGGIITKSIGNMFSICIDRIVQFISTQRVLYRNIKILDDYFYPTLFQREIIKEYELRVFFIDNLFYAMAIFSQLDPKTKLDYRNYNDEKPNRMIPYQLSDDLRQKLTKLVRLLDLNTGSIDLIVTPDSDIYFLEVNPSGQFGWLSYYCNYFLEREIAKFFQTKDHEKVD